MMFGLSVHSAGRNLGQSVLYPTPCSGQVNDFDGLQVSGNIAFCVLGHTLIEIRMVTEPTKEFPLSDRRR